MKQFENAIKNGMNIKKKNKTMRKRDSIEFLWDEFKSFLPANYTVDESVKILSILKQARAMHKEEIENAQMDMFICLNELPYSLQYLEKRQSAEDFATHYYNETFGGNNEQQ